MARETFCPEHGVYHIQAGRSMEWEGRTWSPVFCGDELTYVPQIHTVSSRGFEEIEAERPWRLCRECVEWARREAE